MAWCGQRIGFLRSRVPNNLHVVRVLTGVGGCGHGASLCTIARQDAECDDGRR